MEACPFCDHRLSDGGSKVCPECGRSLVSSPASHYLETIGFLGEALTRMASGAMTPAEALQTFRRWMGSVQRVLNLANEDLEEQLKIIRRHPEIDTLDVIKRFGMIQDDITAYLEQLSDLFGNLHTPHDFESSLPRMEQLLSMLNSRIVDLEQFEAVEFERVGPLPPPVSASLDHLEKVMGNLATFTESRDTALLNDIIQDLDRARALLDAYRREIALLSR